MQLTIKTLKGETFPVEVQANHTVLDLKEKIKELKGYEVDAQKIVFKGKATNNADELEKIGVKEGDFLVIMTLAKKPQPKKEDKKQEKAEDKKQEKSAEEKPKPTQPQEKPQVNQEQNNAEFEASVNELTSMGFTKQKCEQALRAAFNDKDRAVEYLINGIPSNPIPPQQGGGDMAGGMLSAIVNNPQFAQIRQMIRNDPSTLQPILQQIAQTSPQLYALIAQNPQAFEQLIMEGGQGGEGGHIPQMSQPPQGSIMITHEEEEAINRLRALGFSKMEAAQAYLACDKNEQLAANLLFDRLANGDIEMDPDFHEGGNQGGNNQGGNNQGGNNQGDKKGSNNQGDKKGGNDQGGNNQGDDDDDNLFN